MSQIYLDNAATTSVRPEVVEEMVKVLTNDFGNPSSTYSIGRNAKSLIESARKSIYVPGIFVSIHRRRRDLCRDSGLRHGTKLPALL